MLKKIFFILSILFFLFSENGYSQNAKLVFTDSMEVDMDQYFGKDVLGFDYFAKNNVLYKQKKSEKWEYKNLPLGKINSIDVINPLKTLIFYKDFNTVVLLDNQLSEITKINLNDFNIVAQTCSIASQNRLWIYDNLSNSLLLLDYLNKKNTVINQPFKNTFKYYKSNYNSWVRISEENKLYTYDNYGRVSELGKIPDFDKILITDSGKNLFSLDENLYLYKNHVEGSEEILSNGKTIESFSFSNGILTIFTGKTITNYTLNLP